MCLLVSHVPVSCSMSCDPVPHFLGCLCALVHGLRALVRSQYSAFHLLWQGRPGQAYHSCLWASAWLHRIPGAIGPPASPAIGLKWPSGPPSARNRVAPATLRTTLPRRINRILLQSPVHPFVVGALTEPPKTSLSSTSRHCSWQGKRKLSSP